MNLYSIRKQLNMGIPITKIKLKVTDYSRVSTTHIEQLNSLKNQIEHFDTMIKNNPNWTYVKGYIDDGISGTTDIKRNNFMKMINDAKEGKFDLIITKEISRFSRNTIDSIKYTRELLTYGVAVLFIEDNINTALPDSELRLTIMASLAQDEIRRLSSRVKFGMQQSITKGNILGNNMLYGYKKNKQNNKLEIIKEQAYVIKLIYQMYTINKLSLNKIATYLNEKNIKTSQEKKWTSTSISRIIKNPKYKGYYCGKKSEVIDYMTKKIKYFNKEEWITYEDNSKIPPIIDKITWNLANERLETRQHKFEKNNSTKIYKDKYPLSTKIFCNNHNSFYYRRKQSNNITWICSEYLKKGKKYCNNPYIKENELYQIIEDIEKHLNITTNNILNILSSTYNPDLKDAIQNTINVLKKDKQKLINDKKKILELTLEGHLSKQEFSKNNNIINQKINLIENKITELNNKNNTPNEDLNKNLLETISKKINSISIKEKLINILINKIIVNNKNDSIYIDIYFNFKKTFIKNNINIDNNKFLEKEYNFLRSVNITRTKNYNVNYLVNCFHL